MDYELLNKIIDYLEDNLTNNIDTKKLAKSLGLNDFIMQRVFSIITNITITEYVRKRNTRNYSYWKHGISVWSIIRILGSKA